MQNNHYPNRGTLPSERGDEKTPAPGRSRERHMTDAVHPFFVGYKHQFNDAETSTSDDLRWGICRLFTRVVSFFHSIIVMIDVCYPATSARSAASTFRWALALWSTILKKGPICLSTLASTAGARFVNIFTTKPATYITIVAKSVEGGHLRQWDFPLNCSQQVEHLWYQLVNCR